MADFHVLRLPPTIKPPGLPRHVNKGIGGKAMRDCRVAATDCRPAVAAVRRHWASRMRPYGALGASFYRQVRGSRSGGVLRPAALIQAAKGSSPMFVLAIVLS